MLHLPTELWCRIAHFIPDHHLFHLAPLNRLFADLATERRFRQLVLDDDRPPALLAKLAKIQRDPLIAARVRSLVVHPKALRSACLRQARSNPHPSHVPDPDNHWPPPFRYAFGFLATLFPTDHHSLRNALLPVTEDLHLADAILHALAQLPSLQELDIQWKQASDAESDFCLPLLSAIWPVHASHLRVLKLDMNLLHMSDVVSNVSTLDLLQELSLHFTDDDTRMSSSVSYLSKPPLEKLAEFINRLTLTLRDLTLSSIAHLNYSWLFNNLTYFPQLTSLSLLVPCDPRHVPDPSGLHHFLRAHRAIEHLNFSPQYCCHQSTQGPLPSSSSSSHPPTANPAVSPSTESYRPAGSHPCTHPNPDLTQDWLQRTFGGLSFASLRSLELGLNVLGSGGKRVMPSVVAVARAAAAAASSSRCRPLSDYGDISGSKLGWEDDGVGVGTSQTTTTMTGPRVRTLSILGCIISLDDLRLLLEPFASTHPLPSSSSTSSSSKSQPTRPTALILEVHVLDAPLIDLLAEMLPDLERLQVVYRWVGRSGGDDEKDLKTQLASRTYPNWKLWQLELGCSRRNEDARWPCQVAISGCVPGLGMRRG